ncbi:hypothetical protein MBLNU459_g0111t1 [Dothideomycetes sp. NU459]
MASSGACAPPGTSHADDIHYTAQWSQPSASGVSRLSGTQDDRKVRDWFRDQVLALGAEYKVNMTGTQIARFGGQDNSVAPIAMGSHLDTTATGGRMKEQGVRTRTRTPIALINSTNEEGARFFPPCGSGTVYAGMSDVATAHESKANDGSGETLRAALESIGYVGDGPNTFEEFPISAHFEIHVEQDSHLEKAGKAVGWVEGWQGISVFEVTLHGEDGHANTYNMERRRDTLVGGATLICDIERLAYDKGGYSTTTNIQSGPVGCCNIQSWTKIVFCLMHKELQGLEEMGEIVANKARGIAAKHGLELEMSRIMHLLPGNFWPEAIEWVRRACRDNGMAARTGTAHDSTMTRLKCPTGMVFARAKDGISQCAKERTSKEDCAESALVLGKAVLDFDEYLAKGSLDKGAGQA